MTAVPISASPIDVTVDIDPHSYPRRHGEGDGDSAESSGNESHDTGSDDVVPSQRMLSSKALILDHSSVAVSHQQWLKVTEFIDFTLSYMILLCKTLFR